MIKRRGAVAAAKSNLTEVRPGPKEIAVQLDQWQAAILLHFGLIGLQQSAEASEIPPEMLEPFVLLSLEFLPNFAELESQAA